MGVSGRSLWVGQMLWDLLLVDVGRNVLIVVIFGFIVAGL